MRIMSVIDLIAGARPNFMKVAPIIDAMKVAMGRGGKLRYRLIHTGQHYDRAMSGSFFEQLGMPEPDINLDAAAETQAGLTAAIMVRYEQVLLREPSDLCLVVGDVTSAMACAIVAKKCGLQVAHVEGGLRSGDWRMPEEVNRVVTDSISDWFFTTSETANANLRQAGVRDERLFFVGNTMIDTLVKQMPRLRPPTFWNALSLVRGDYFVVTLHRPANVDRGEHLLSLLRTIVAGAKGLPIVFPVHPRTAKILRALGDGSPQLHYVDPLGYLEFNYLVRHARAVITDSGGVTEETTYMGVPCLTLRDNTERPETVTVGTNELVGADATDLARALARVVAGRWKKGNIPDRWDGRTAERIVEVLERLMVNP